MNKTVFIGFRIHNAYKKNGILYMLRSIPFVNKLIPASLYGSRGVEILANLISAILEIGGIFLWKIVYLAILFGLATEVYSQPELSFVHMFVCLTLLGGLLNTQMFNPSKDKFYAIILMRMDAKTYTLIDYGYFLLKTLVGLLPFGILFGTLAGLSLVTCILLPLYVIEIKVCSATLNLVAYKRQKKLKNENIPTKWIWGVVAMLLALAFILPYFEMGIPVFWFEIMALLLVVPFLFALVYILKYPLYSSIYKELLKPETFAMGTSTESVGAAQQIAMQKKIAITTGQTSHKEGFAYFNEIFMKRHASLLTKSAKRTALVEMGILLAVLAACFIKPKVGQNVNELMLRFLPFFLFVMYMLNRGKVITQAMFMNCDHSMLTYRFYRQPKAIVTLFVQRLKDVVLINLLPAGVLALGLPLLLYLTGGTNQPLNYLLLFLSIMVMSVFFSVHNMVLYYLLQPYNINLENKSVAYNIANSVTYVICYVAMGREVSTLLFGTCITCFCIFYIVIGICLVYRLAPKTFKLKE